MRKWRSALALVLTICMVMSLLAVPVWAAGETITLTRDGREVTEVTVDGAHVTINGETADTGTIDVALVFTGTPTVNIWQVGPKVSLASDPHAGSDGSENHHRDTGVQITWDNNGDRTEARITISPTALAGDYEVVAVLVNSEAKAEFTIVQSEASKTTPTSFTALGALEDMTIPATLPEAGEDAEQTVSVTGAKNIYGDDVATPALSAFTWSVTPANEGVTVENGVIKVAAGAKDYVESEKDYTVTATLGNQSDRKTVTVKRAQSQETALTISGPAEVRPPQTEDAVYSAQVCDQYGKTISGKEVTLSMEAPEGGEIPSGVDFDPGTKKLQVSNTAAAGTVVIRAVCGTLTATKEVAIGRADSILTTVILVSTAGGSSATVSEVSVDGKTNPAALKANAQDQYGVLMNSGVSEWTVIPAGQGVSVAEDGTVTVDKMAVAGDYQITANGQKSTSLTVTRLNLDVIDDFTVTQPSDVVIPTGSDPVTQQIDVENVKNVYGPIPDEDLTAVKESYTWTYTMASHDGVSINESTGLITVTSAARPQEGSPRTFQLRVTVEAKKDGQQSVSKFVEVTFREDTPHLRTVELTPDAPTVNGEGPTTVTASPKDQYGGAYNEPISSWTISPDDEYVSIDESGVVTIDGKTPDGKTYSVTADGVSSRPFTVHRDNVNVLTTFTLGAISAITVPASLPEAGESVTEQVTVGGTKNIYGDPLTVTADKFTWTIKDGTNASPAGVSIGAHTGLITVTADAKDVVEDAAGKNFTVTATLGSVTANQTVHIARADQIATAAAIDVTGKTALTVPAAGDEASKTTYTVSATDQYGSDISSPTADWTGAEITGDRENVTFADGVLTVRPCAEDTTVTLKAKVGDAVAAEQTVTVTRGTPEAATVRIYRDNGDHAITEDTVVIPGEDATGDNTYGYSAKLFDQYGSEIADPEFVWAATAGTSKTVTFSAGTLTVKKGAVKDTTVTITAAASGKTGTLTVKLTDLSVNWAPVEDAYEGTITYGQTRADAFTGLPATGTADVSNATRNGAFQVLHGDETPAAGATSVVVRFTVTDDEDKGTFVDHTMVLTVNKRSITADGVTAARTEDTALIYTGADLTPAITVADTGAPITANDYVITYDAKNAGTGKATITGQGNYEGTREVTFAIARADIVSLGNNVSRVILASEGKDAAGLAALLPEKTSGARFGTTQSSAALTDELELEWTGMTPSTLDPKGGTYTFTGSVKAGQTGESTNFNHATRTLVGTVKVVAVNATADIAERAVTVGYSKITDEATYRTFKLPASVTVTYEAAEAVTGASAPGAVTFTGEDLKWDPDLTGLKRLNVGVHPVKLASLPGWATAEADNITVNVTVTSKIPVNVAVTKPDDVVYGTPVADPAMTVTADETNEETDVPAAPKWTFQWEGTDGTTYGPTATRPTNVGKYLVTATLNDTAYEGAGKTNAAFEITPKSMTAEGINIGLSAAAFPYTGADQKPVLTVKDGDATLRSGTDYTVTWPEDVKNAQASITVTVTGAGNYKEDKTASYAITPAPIASLKPTLSGEGKIGEVLSAAMPSTVIDAPNQITWAWGYLAGETFTAMSPAKTGPSYTITADDAGRTVAAQATGAAGETLASGAAYTGNYYGVAVSGGVAVPQIDLTGTAITIVDSTPATPISVGDRLTIAGLPNDLAGEDYTVTWTVTLHDGDPQTTADAALNVPADAATVSAAIAINESCVKYKGALTIAAELGKTPLAGTLTLTLSAGVVTLTNGITTDAEGYDLVWYRDGAAFENDGTTYTTAADDAGKSIAVKAVAKGDCFGEIASNEVTGPAAAPAAPAVTASAGNEQAAVTWQAPATHGAPITGYAVYQKAEGAADYTKVAEVAANVTSYTVTGLTNDTSYTFAVEAQSAAGTSPKGESAAVTPAAPANVPSGPSGPSGSDDEPEGEKVTNPDGSVTTTVIDEDGTITATTEALDGTVTEVVTKPDGSATGAVTQKNGVKAASVTTAAGETTATVTVPRKVAEAKVTIPVPQTKPGTVAVLVNADGTETILRNSVPVDGGVVVKLEESAQLKIVDNAKNFVDVPGHWAEQEIAFVSAREIFQGTGNDTFSTEVKMNRCMMVTALFRLDGELKGESSLSFADVAADTYYTDSVAWAAELKLVEGYTDGTFAPLDNITREQLFTLIYRYAKLKGMVKDAPSGKLTFADNDKIFSYAQEAVTWLVENDLIHGKPGNLLDPKGLATRAEVAAMLEHFIRFAAR